MVKKRRSAAREALGRQQAEQKRTVHGKRYVGDDTGSQRGRAAERAKVLQMQVADRERREQVRRSKAPVWEAVGDLILVSARLAVTAASVPFRLARLPFRIAAAMVPRLRPA